MTGATSVDMGLILVDQGSLDIIAVDRGAALILKQHGGKSEVPRSLPPEMVHVIQKRGHNEDTLTKRQLRLAKTEYTCRVYSLSGLAGGAAIGDVLGVHLEKDWSTADAMEELAAQYHLTSREQQVLQGMSQGLATKEIATQMDISPNTVKAFVRLVLIKMGVTTRTGAVGKLLRNGVDIE